MLGIHSEALENVNAIYHEFLLCYKAHTKKVYGIVEGKEDPIYYKGLISQLLPDDWDVEFIVAGCKNKVLESITFFDWARFSPRRICFFVDRDLSDFFPERPNIPENLYITDNYSIENDVVNFAVFKRLMEEVLNISGLRSDEIDDIERRFNNGLCTFREIMIPIMSQVIYWYRHGQKPCLDHIRLKDFFDFVNGTVSLKNHFLLPQSRLEHVAKCVSLESATLENLISIESEFRMKLGGERYIRGKFLIWFMAEFALDVHRSILNIVKRFTNSPKLKVTIGYSNLMIFVAPRTRCPESLKAFLIHTFGQYIADFMIIE